MSSIIVFLGVLVLGYISTTFLFNKIQSRYYLPSGIEYIVLGIILGPAFSNWFSLTFGLQYPQVIDQQMLVQLNPGITAAIGFIGFIYGLKFRIRNISPSKPEHWRLAFFEIMISVLIIGGLSFAALYYFFFNGKNLQELIAASYAMGLIGSLSSNFLIKSIIQKHNIKGFVSQSLHQASLININILIFLYGFLFASVHVGSKENINFTPTEWVVISLVLTLIIGFLFFIFLGRESDSNKQFVAILGIVLFTSGVAYYVNFSPLYMNFVLGAILANVSKTTENLEASLERIFHPLSILIVVMVGFYWVPTDLVVFVIATIAYLSVRYLSKSISGKLAFHTAFDKEHLSKKVGMGLLPHDIIACAMILDYMHVYKNELTPIVVSAVLMSVIFYGVFSYSHVKNLLVDSGEIARERI